MADDWEVVSQPQQQQRAPAPPLSRGQAGQDLWEKVSSPEPAKGLGDKLWDMLKAGGRGAAQGMMDVGMGTTQLLSQAIPGQAGERARGDVQQQIRQAGQSYAASPSVQQHPWAAGAGRIGGNVLATAPLAAIPGMGAGPALGSRMAQLGARAGVGALGGAAGAATAPVERGDYWPEKLKQLSTAAGLGAGLGAAGGMIGPQITAPIQKLMQTFPNLVRMGAGMGGRTREAFQRAMGNQVLEPIGASLPRNIKPGDDLVNTVYDRLSDAYNKILPNVTFDGRDPSFHRRLSRIIADAGSDLSDAAASQFSRYLKTYIGKPIAASGGASLGGEAFKRVEERLGARVRQFSKSSVTDEQIFGEHLKDVLDLMRDTLVSQNPQYGPELQRINAAYHRYVTMDLAAERNVDARRTFTPHDVSMVLGAGGAQARRRMSPDDGLMRAFAEAGDSMLQGKAPGWSRLLGHVVGSIGGFTAGEAVGHPLLGMGAGSYAGSAAGEGLAGALGRITGSPAARQIGGAISRAAPAVGEAQTRLRRRDALTEAVPSVGGP